MMSINKSFLRLITLTTGVLTFLLIAESQEIRNAIDPIVDLSEMWIVAESTNSSFAEKTVDDSDSIHLEDLVTQLKNLPGLDFIQRGEGSSEPLIRGVALDRVASTTNGMRLPNASPTRTHAPILRFESMDGKSITLNAAVPSLTLGPPVTGGWIEVDTKWQESHATLSSSISSVYEANRAGWSSHLFHPGAAWNQKLKYQLSLNQKDLGNFQSADGQKVASHQKTWGAALDAKVLTGERWQHQAGFQYQHQALNENASLPLDTVEGEFFAVTAAHLKMSPDQKDWDFRARYGYSENDVILNNRNRGAKPMLVQNKAGTRTYHSDLQFKLRPNQETTLRIGMDLNRENKLAIRNRGPVAKDYIWPDTIYDQVGLFTEGFFRVGENTVLRAGARLDHVGTKAQLANEKAFGHEIQSLYNQYGEGTELSSKASDQVFSANLLYQSTLNSHLSIYSGIASTGQIPGATERYRAFLNALGGGFEIGNPALAPERKWEWSSGVNFHHQNFYLQLETFYSVVEDYQWREKVGTTAGVLPLPAAQSVYSYRNVDTSFTGVEISGAFRLAKNWQFPFSFAWVEAQLQSNGVNYRKGDRLPELPGTTARFSAVRSWNLNPDLEFHLRFDGSWTGSRSNALPQVNPIYANSDAYTLWDLQLSTTFHNSIKVGLSVLNLFDTQYAPYLSLPASGATAPGSELLSGDRVPGPGRQIQLLLKCEF